MTESIMLEKATQAYKQLKISRNKYGWELLRIGNLFNDSDIFWEGMTLLLLDISLYRPD